MKNARGLKNDPKSLGDRDAPYKKLIQRELGGLHNPSGFSSPSSDPDAALPIHVPESQTDTTTLTTTSTFCPLLVVVDGGVWKYGDPCAPFPPASK